MSTKRSLDQLNQKHLPATVKEEPPDEEQTESSFCYETVIKEEVILEDQEELADQLEYERESASPEMINKHPFKCPECNRTFDKLINLKRCAKRHEAIRLELYKCKICGKCSSEKSGNARHEAKHENRLKQLLSIEEFGKHRLEKKSSLFHCIESTDEIEKLKSEKLDEKSIVLKLERFKCNRCGRCFPSEAKLTKHDGKHRKADIARRYGLYQCRFCDMRYGSQGTRRKHELKHHPNTKLLRPAKEVNPRTRKVVKPSAKLIKKHKKPKEEPDPDNAIPIPEAAEKDNKEEETHTDENSSSFCYETVMKEELIIEDEPIEDETGSESEEEFYGTSGEQIQTKESGAAIQLNDAEFPMKDHRLTSHSESDKNKCDVCQKTFVNRQVLQQHKRKFHKKSHNRFECQRCHKKFDDRYSFSMHSKTHKKVFRAKNEELLIVKEENAKYECYLCEKSFTNRTRGLTHVQVHMIVIEGAFECKICGLRLSGNFNYQSHIKMHNGSSEPLPRKIGNVHVAYESSSDAACEMSDLPLHCKTCDVFFNNKTNFNIHMWKSKLRIIRSKINAAGGESSEGSNFVADLNGFFNCSKCDFKTNKPSMFKVHNHYHKGLYTCKLCKLRCLNPSHLKRHKATHGKDFKCHKCEEQFKTQKGLERHLVQHNRKYRRRHKTQGSYEANKVKIEEKDR